MGCCSKFKFSYTGFNYKLFIRRLKPNIVTDFTDSPTTPNELTNPKIKTVFTIVLKHILKAKHREIIEIKYLRVESCETSEIKEFGTIIQRQMLLQSARVWNKCAISGHLAMLRPSHLGALRKRQRAFKKISESQKGTEEQMRNSR